MAGVCEGFLGAGGLMYTTILPLAAGAAIFAFVVTLIVYYLGLLFSHPKLLTWAKTELVQLFVSLSAVIFILAGMNLFCSLDAGSVRGLFGSDATVSGNIFDEAENYLLRTTDYANYAMSTTRYYLSAYSIFVYRYSFDCTLGGIGCLFGGSGTSYSPLANYGGRFGALNTIFNTTLLYFLTSANMLFILLFAYKGFILFFLPVAVIIRSLPYLRSLGAALMSVCLAFFIVYPLVLSVFSLASDSILFEERLSLDEGKFESVSGWSDFAYGSILGALGTTAYTNDELLKEKFFPDGEDFFAVLSIAGKAFVVSFVLPSLALAATLATVRYFARFYGEDIDLSRISQLV